MTDPLARIIAGDLTDYVPTASPLSDEQLRAVAAALHAHPDAVLEALGYEQVGWYAEERHKHSPNRGVCCGEFKFTEEVEPGCNASFVPAYAIGAVDV